jgi:hypothetical protein
MKNLSCHADLSLWVGNLIADKSDLDRTNSQTGLADQIS